MSPSKLTIHRVLHRMDPDYIYNPSFDEYGLYFISGNRFRSISSSKLLDILSMSKDDDEAEINLFDFWGYNNKTTSPGVVGPGDANVSSQNGRPPPGSNPLWEGVAPAKPPRFDIKPEDCTHDWVEVTLFHFPQLRCRYCDVKKS